MGFTVLISFVLLMIIPGFIEAAPKNVFQNRFIFYRAKMELNSDRDILIAVMRAGAKAGYNGVVLDDDWGEYSILESMPANFFANVDSAKAEAKRLGMIIFPTTVNQREAGGKNKSLYEAFPVINTRFVVQSGNAVPEGSPAVVLKNTGFETYSGNSPSDWAVNNPGVVSFMDQTVMHGGTSSIRIEKPPVMIKLQQSVTSDSFKAYTVSMWIKTEGFLNSGYLEIRVDGNNGTIQRPLFYNRSKPMGATLPSATQDWKQYRIDFNSLNCKAITIFLQIPASAGKMWVDDFELKEVGLYNTIRRTSTPVTVRSSDGVTTYKEGTDYAVGIQKLTIPAGSLIQNGDVLKVTWYQFAHAEHWESPAASACNPEYYSLIRTSITNILKLFPKSIALQMDYDEWREGFWDPACISAYKTAGEYMGDVVRKTEAIVRELSPTTTLYVWNDMYDPYHNAKANYYMCNGSLLESWQGVGPNTGIMNWLPVRFNNLKFWAGIDPAYPTNRIHRPQILCGYYESLNNIRSWLAALDKAEAEGVTDVNGFMFTTWVANYADLEAVANLIKQAGRWGTGPADVGIEDGKKTEKNSSAKYNLKHSINPLHQTLEIQYEIPAASHVKLSILNITGQEVKRLSDEDNAAGFHRLVWDRVDIPSGVYFVSLLAGDKKKNIQRLAQKVLLLN